MNLAICRVAIAPLRADKSDCAEMVSQILFGEIISKLDTFNNWIFIETYIDKYQGWVDGKQLEFLNEKEIENWSLNKQIITKNCQIKTNIGTLNLTKGAFLHKNSPSKFNIGEIEIKSNYKHSTPSLIAFAKSYLNTPYLWGGKTNYGIDCSGFTQIVFRNEGIELPRDASQQEKYGNPIFYQDRKTGDIAFFANSEGKIIHVGILISKSKIIHASGRVKIDTIDTKGIFSNELNDYSHTLYSIKRMI
jgi:cell wall-associated NlpC family hydrolase